MDGPTDRGVTREKRRFVCRVGLVVVANGSQQTRGDPWERETTRAFGDVGRCVEPCQLL